MAKPRAATSRAVVERLIEELTGWSRWDATLSMRLDRAIAQEES